MPAGPHAFLSPIGSRHGSYRVCRWPPSGVCCSRPQRTTRPTANHGEPSVAEGTVSFSFHSHIDASARKGDSGDSCEDGAASAGARCTSSAEDQVHIMGVAALFDQVCFPALAARGRSCRTRPAAKPVRAGYRDTSRLAFGTHSSNTARTAARDSCERGLAVHSVRSWAGERTTCGSGTASSQVHGYRAQTPESEMHPPMLGTRRGRGSASQGLYGRASRWAGQ